MSAAERERVERDGLPALRLPSLRRSRIFACHRMVLLSVLLATACGKGGKPAEDPGGVGYDHVTPEADDTALPRYFTIEAREGGVWVNGAKVADNDLDAVLTQGANDSSNRGAAIIYYSEGPAAKQLLERVARAGFSHVLLSGVSAAVVGGPLKASKSPESEAPVRPTVIEEQPPAETAPANAEPEPADLPEDVEVKHYGLHIGGGPNTDEARDAYFEPIGRRFDDLLRCHLLAENRSRQASFGVDLVIPASGGRAKIDDYRTSLKGKDFQMCVLNVLGEVRFPKSEHPRSVSYSMLFKPGR